MASILEEDKTETQTQRGECYVKSNTDTQGECHVMMEVEIGIILLEVKEHQELPATTRS